MQFWDTIINTAMMGTDKKQVSIGEVPAGLEEAATIVSENAENDREEKFLQLAALTLSYRQCGVLPLQKELQMIAAPAEEKAYCNAMALQVLKDIISEESIHLLKFWLQHCYDKQQIILPELVPELLAKGAEQKKLQLLIGACCGKRGEWLAIFNPAWNLSSTQTGEELWQTGTPEQRKEILKQTRVTDPTRAREWLQQTWTQEDVNTKTSLLELLAENACEADIPFLESLATEKSKKVKDIAVQLLKRIPASTIVQMYEKALGLAVVIKREKALLGMMSKTTLQCRLPESIDESIYKTGIDKLSNKKELSDDEYVISQLVQAVPPSFWEKHLEMNPEQIIDLFQKDAAGKKIIPSLVNAITCFHDTKWAFYFMQHSQVFYIDIIPLLQAQQQEAYSNKFFDKYPDSIIRFATGRETEWGIELTKNIFRYAAKNPYQYNRSFYNQYIHLVPVQVVAELERCTPPEEHLRVMWSNTSEYIINLITLKIQTIKAFNI